MSTFQSDQHIFLNKVIMLMRSKMGGKYVRVAPMFIALGRLDNIFGEYETEHATEKIYSVLGWGYKKGYLKLKHLIQAGMDLDGHSPREVLLVSFINHGLYSS